MAKKNRRARKGEINGDLVDRFTLLHFGSGVALGLSPMPFWLLCVGAVGWELAENPLKDNAPALFPNPTHDRLGNAVFDALAMVAGGVVGKAVQHLGWGRWGGLRAGSALPSGAISSTGALVFWGAGLRVAPGSTQPATQPGSDTPPWLTLEQACALVTTYANAGGESVRLINSGVQQKLADDLIACSRARGLTVKVGEP